MGPQKLVSLRSNTENRTSRLLGLRARRRVGSPSSSKCAISSLRCRAIRPLRALRSALYREGGEGRPRRSPRWRRCRPACVALSSGDRQYSRVRCISRTTSETSRPVWGFRTDTQRTYAGAITGCSRGFSAGEHSNQTAMAAWAAEPPVHRGCWEASCLIKSGTLVSLDANGTRHYSEASSHRTAR